MFFDLQATFKMTKSKWSTCLKNATYIYLYAPPWGLSTLAKELSAAASVMQSSS